MAPATQPHLRSAALIVCCALSPSLTVQLSQLNCMHNGFSIAQHPTRDSGFHAHLVETLYSHDLRQRDPRKLIPECPYPDTWTLKQYA